MDSRVMVSFKMKLRYLRRSQPVSTCMVWCSCGSTTCVVDGGRGGGFHELQPGSTPRCAMLARTGHFLRATDRSTPTLPLPPPPGPPQKPRKHPHLRNGFLAELQQCDYLRVDWEG